MRVRALLSALAATMCFAGTAAAQTDPEPGATETSSGWRVWPRERHLLVRAEATTAFRLQDVYAQGSLAPVTAFVQGSYQFLHLGKFLLGPSVGLQLGFDASGAQYAVQPGVQLYRRFSSRFAFTARVDVPILIARGSCEPGERLPVPVTQPQFRGAGIPSNVNSVPVPTPGFCPTVAFGVEVAAGAAFYLRSGFALTGELTVDYYRGDTLGFPLVGAGLGVLFDYEVLP